MATGSAKKATPAKKEAAPKVENFAEVAEEKAPKAKATKKEGDDLKIVEGIGPKSLIF